MNSGKAG